MTVARVILPSRPGKQRLLTVPGNIAAERERPRLVTEAGPPD